MTIEISQILTIVCFSFASVYFILAIVLFFFFKIPKIISDLTGVSAKKEIQSIIEQNMETGKISFSRKVGEQSKSQKVVISDLQQMQNLQQEQSQKSNRQEHVQNIQQGEIKIQQSSEQEVIGYGVFNEAANIDESGANNTEILKRSEDIIQTSSPEIGETSLLSSPEIGETSILSNAPVSIPYMFKIDVEISFAESTEIIVED